MSFGKLKEPNTASGPLSFNVQELVLSGLDDWVGVWEGKRLGE